MITAPCCLSFVSRNSIPSPLPPGTLLEAISVLRSPRLPLWAPPQWREADPSVCSIVRSLKDLGRSEGDKGKGQLNKTCKNGDIYMKSKEVDIKAQGGG